MFWRRPNSERKWLEIKREDEGSGWKNQISEYNILILVKGSKWNLFICEMTKLPPTPFCPPSTRGTPCIHTYVYVCYVYEIEEEEGGRREVIT